MYYMHFKLGQYPLAICDSGGDGGGDFCDSDGDGRDGISRIIVLVVEMVMLVVMVAKIVMMVI